MKASQAGWKVHRHGGGRRHGWRVQFTGNELPARNQFRLSMHAMQQGGVRLVKPNGLIADSYWRRHAPGAKPQHMTAEIGKKARLG